MKELFCLEDVQVTYGNEKVIKGVSLSISKGEFCALLGLNGSGKTTVLHAACGFIPMKGRCMVNGADCARLNEKQRARFISFIPQVSSLAGGRSALDVVMMGFNPYMNLFESHSAGQRKAAVDTLDKLGLASLSGCDFGKLSQGQKQLVIFARCMVQNAPMMLMDEPDSSLDFLNRHMVLGKIRDMIQSDELGGLITLHDPNFAMSYCDKLFLLKDGILAAEVSMKNACLDEVIQKLSLIYGTIDAIPHGNSFMIGKS